ncbi:MAG: exonuclease domain-containing protein [Actinobacteria bacterium]|nr:exonuclease domain-containing protein [Actinomycetota bacterium]
MQLQLSMAVADRLHETLLVRGEPLGVAEAACLLVAAPSCPAPLCRCVLDALVRDDHRFCLVEDSRGISLRHWEVPDPDLAEIAFVALDLETTGARPGRSKITEIGAVRIEGFREVAHFNTLVNPMRPIPPMITQITGITQEMVADAPRIDEVIPGLLDFLKGAIVVAHNAAFDVGFLNYELRRLKGRQLGGGAIDTLPLARALAPGLPNYRLGTVANALGAPVGACHRALADAQAACHVFVTLVGRLQEQGMTRLSEVRSFANPHSRTAVDKLRLTRDIPWKPGAYHFLDKEGHILYVGKADRLRERVRSHFVANATPTRKVRQAIRLVEHISWDETHTSLEAVVREQELILQHRPPCNFYGSRPENYTYVKVANSKLGLHLVTTTRGPRPFREDGEGEGRRQGGSMLLGPFRGRARLSSAIDLLCKIYPIRRCPRHPDGRPCVRGIARRCLAPCTGDPEVKAGHDALVTTIVDWLAGSEGFLTPYPQEKVDELTWALSQQRRYEEAQRTRDAWDDLLSIRKSYASLVEARALCFASLWPLDNGDGPELRMNLVWGGRLAHQVSLTRGELRQGFETALAALDDTDFRPLVRSSAPYLVAVPQHELDMLLAVRRWFLEADKPVTVMLDTKGGDDSQTLFERWQNQLQIGAQNLL